MLDAAALFMAAFFACCFVQIAAQGIFALRLRFMAVRAGPPRRVDFSTALGCAKEAASEHTGKLDDAGKRAAEGAALTAIYNYHNYFAELRGDEVTSCVWIEKVCEQERIVNAQRH